MRRGTTRTTRDELDGRMRSALEEVYEALLEAVEERLMETAPVNDLIH